MVALRRPPASPEIVRHSGYGPMTFPAAVRPGRVPVGVVLQAVAAVDREEREARVDLLHPASRSERALTVRSRSEEHTSELQSPCNLVCRLLLEKKKKDTLTLR